MSDRLRGFCAFVGVAVFASVGYSGDIDATKPTTPTTQPVGKSVEKAVLILRAMQDGRSPTPSIDVLSPRGLRWPLRFSDDAPRPGTDRKGAPQLGDEFELRRVWHPPGKPMRYYIYEIDLSDPRVARNWRNLAREQFDESRRQRATRRSERRWQRRERRLIAASESAVYDGCALMQAGAYRDAVITLTRAAEMNHGDAASRIHLAQARLALGHDVEGGAALRRALQLQPKLVPMRLDLSQYYPTPREFVEQVDALAARLESAEKSRPEAWFLLGFMQFQRGKMDAAHEAFQRVAESWPADDRVRKYLSLTKPAAS